MISRRTFVLGTLPAVIGAAPPRGSEWPQYKGDAGLSGVSPDDSIKPPLRLVWSYRTDGDTSGDAGAGVTVAGGLVYVVVINTNSILALHADDGRFAWEFADPNLSHNSVPTYNDGRLFVWKRRYNRSEVVALDARTGKSLWQQALPVGGRFESRTGLPVAEGKLYCVEGGDDPAVVALDTKTGERLWRTGLGKEDGTHIVAPTVAGGRVFVATRTGFGPSRADVGATVALNAADGKILWRRRKVFPLRPPASDGKVVACPMAWSADSRFHLLDATTGETLWSTPPRPAYIPSSITKDLVLLKPYGGEVIAVDRATGKEVWKFSGRTTSGCCAPTVSGGYAYFGTGVIAPGDLEGIGAWQHVSAPREKAGYGTLFALDLKTGKPAWHFSTGNTVCGEPAIAYGRLYAAGRDGKVYCFAPAGPDEPPLPLPRDTSPAVAAEDVKKLLVADKQDRFAPGSAWPMLGGGPARSGLEGGTLRVPPEPAWTCDTGGRIVTAPAIRDGKVFAGNEAGKFVAVEARSGRAAWTVSLGAPLRCSPAVAGGLVYCGTDAGRLVALDAESGKQRWAFEAGGPVQSSPVVAGGLLIFAANDHCVYALDRESGKKQWHFRADYYCFQAPPVVHGERVYVGQWADWVHALDLATGKPLWRSFVPISVEALTYHRDRLYVRTPNYVAELDPATGKRLRIGLVPYGYGGLAFLKNHLFVAGIRSQYGTQGTMRIDLDDAGADPKPIPTLEDVRQFRGKMLPNATGMSAVTTPLVVGELLCIASREGRLILTDAEGKSLWSHALGGQGHSSPASAAGLLVAGCDNGLLYAFK